MTTPQHLSDRYELGEILGFGGMSEVHLARDLRLHRDVAVKVLRADLACDPSFYLRFRREAQNAAALNHPAIVAVYDTGEAETAAGPLPYIVMEYVDGVTLRDIVHNDGPLPPRRAIEIIADACQALNFSHQNGIIHRDVKPANIMISTTNAVKVMDFGIARAIADSGLAHGSARAHARPRQRLSDTAPDRMGGPVGRWVVAVAVLAVLTIVVVIAFNTFGGSTRDVQVPDMRGQVSADAVAALQN